MYYNIAELLKCPRSGESVSFKGGNFVSVYDQSVVFPVENGIIRAFLMPDEGNNNDITVKMQEFYRDAPFPNYNEMDNIGSLIEKSLSRIFPDVLNRSIPPHATVLEAGCGTGQFGNFLSIPGRKVLSFDATLNSLALGQQFKERNKLSGVVFAQMNIFNLPLKSEKFDVVICTGVLHHTNDPEKGFHELVRLVKPGGYIIIGLYNLFGRLKTRLRRSLSKLLGEWVYDLDPYIQSHSLDEEKKRAWIQDQYKNPHESLHTVDEVMKWFDSAGIEFVRNIPGTLPNTTFKPEYRESLFTPEEKGTHPERILSQLNLMIDDIDGGLSITIGKRM